MPTEPQAAPSSPGRARRIALALVLVVAVVAAGTWAALSMRDEGPDPADVGTSSPATEPPSPVPTTPAAEPVDPAIFESTPVPTWETSAADLMGTSESGVTVAAPDPAGRPNQADVVVLAAWGGDSAAVIGLDRATGAQVWRQDLPGVRPVACHVLGDGRRTACTVPVSEGSADHRVLTLDTAAGDILGDDTVPQTPRHVVAVSDDIVVAGSNVADGRLMMSRGTPDDVDRFWVEESQPGFVPATEYWGEYTTDEGKAAFEVSGSTMLVELATGDARLGRSDDDGRLGLWPGGATTRTTFTDGDGTTEGTSTTTLTRPDGTELTFPDSPWGRFGTSESMAGVVGAGSTAYDSLTGDPLWTAPERTDVLDTTYLVVDDTVVQASWYEESAQLLALDLRTGEEAWTASARSYATSALHGRVLVLGSYWELTAVDLETGESPWQLAYESDMAGDDFYWDNTVEHLVVGDALVTVSYDTVRGYGFS
ncbi:PQQ-binding-like beta-propeller repeat protein [Sanguibacter sp. 25GB23B1]|uniref:outer membrane protein assembly factor BamB family protein n=1 Tax=unclassified Sanguibacter TaxID=2645534 RepID=UPI0032AF9EDC